MVDGFRDVFSAATMPNIGHFFAFVDSGNRGGMMCGGGGGAGGGIGAGGEVFCSMRFLSSIYHGGPRHPYGRHEAPLPARKHTQISQHARHQVSIVKTRKHYHY
jgi:hypothetical protein